jgi:hypothetical protein
MDEILAERLKRINITATLHGPGLNPSIKGWDETVLKIHRKYERQLPGTWTKGETPGQQIPQLLTPQVRSRFTSNPKLLINDLSVIFSF